MNYFANKESMDRAGHPEWPLPTGSHPVASETAAARQRFANSRTEGAEAPGWRAMPWVWVAAAVTFITIAGIYAFTATFSYFAFYDDEGFLMASVEGFITGHPLYDEVFTIYGPAYYFYEWIIYAIASVPVSHDSTGIICAAQWVGAALFLALAGGSLTRSKLMGFFIFMQATVHLRALANEPGHPQGFVVLLLASASLAAALQPRSRHALLVLGALGAALLLTKINLGVFYGLGLLIVLLFHTPLFHSRRSLSLGLLILSGIFPFVLMRHHLVDARMRDYAWGAGVTLLSVAATAYAFRSERRITLGEWSQVFLGSAGTCVFLVAGLLLTGSSLPAMFDCLVRVPSSNFLAGAHCLPLAASRGSVEFAGGAALVVAMAICFRKQLEQIPLLVATVKAIYGVLGTLLLVREPTGQLAYLLPWIWLVLLPANNQGPEARERVFPRTVLVLFAAWQMLQAYPVAGSQIAIATFLAVLGYSLCLHDALKAFTDLRWVAPELRRIPPRTAVLLTAMLLASLLYLFLARWCSPGIRWRSYTSVPSLALPGAHLIRLPEWQVIRYQKLAQFLETECDAFFTVPGFNSLHFWARKRPLTYLNALESVCLNHDQQVRVIAALRTAKRPLIVVNGRRVDSMSDAEVMGDGPLAHFVLDDCAPVKRLSGCQILAPRGDILRQASR